jgi:hypothetical protein
LGLIPPIPFRRSVVVPRIAAVFASLQAFVEDFAQRGVQTTTRNCWRIAVVLATTTTLSAQAVPAPKLPPAPDVYLAPLEIARGIVAVGTPLNITDRVGYDNQPAFSSDGSGIFFTSVRADAQADIYRYDIDTKATRRITATAPESEYSATSIDGGRAISVIRVERDSAQRLWRFPLDGAAPSVILERIRPVGYHAWADDRTLVLFVLGSPNSLQVADVTRGTGDTITTGIGRSLHRIPGSTRVSFVRKVSPAEWWIESLDAKGRTTVRLVRLPEGIEDYAWLPDGSIICGNGSRLLRWTSSSGEWQQIADFGSARIGGITRIAVSPRADRVAFVAEGRP